jgi:valyl-tRNA synthetase
MHPMIPFITETIWWRLNEVWPDRGLPGRIDSAKSKRLVGAAWPKVGSFAEAAEFLFPKIQEIVVAIRNVRNEYIATLPKGTDAKAEAKRVLTASIRAPGDACRTVNENRGVIELLATCSLKAVERELTPPADASHVTAGCDVYIEGLVDRKGEEQRKGKRADELAKTIAALKGRLANESYTAKAPPHLVQQTRNQLAEAEAELAKVQSGH